MGHDRRKIRVLYIVGRSARFLAFEWLARELNREKFVLSFLLVGGGPAGLARKLTQQGIAVDAVASPSDCGFVRAVRLIAAHCRERSVYIVHIHFMDACRVGLLGAYLAGVRVRLHTRHHAGPYPAYHRPRWGVWCDCWNNWLSTAIIAPSEQTRRTLVDYDGVSPRKAIVIPHGFDLPVFRDAGDAAAGMRQKYGLGNDGPIIGVVARYEKIKGLEYIIRAFGRLLTSYPTAQLVLANARGNGAGPIRRLLKPLPESCYREIPFEDEIAGLYKTFDVFVHAPIHARLESFGQVYIEALAAGVPCVCTRAGIAAEFLSDGVNALLVRPCNSEEIHQGLVRILGDPALRERLIANGRRSVERFGLRFMVDSLEQLYEHLFVTHGGQPL